MNDNYKYIDLSYLKSSSQNVLFIKKMIDLFEEEVPRIEKRMQSALENKDWEKLSEAAHKAKSSIGIVGMNKTKEEMHELEIDTKNNEKEETYVRRVNEFIKICKEAVLELKEAVKNL